MEFCPTWCIVWRGADGSFRTAWRWYKDEADKEAARHPTLQPVVLHKLAVFAYIKLRGGEWGSSTTSVMEG